MNDNKIILDINPVMDDGFSVCRHFLIVSVSSFWNRRYELMYADTWGFTFAPPGTKGPGIWNRGNLGPRLFCQTDINQLSLLEDFHGIKLILQRYDGDSIIRVTGEELSNNNPVIAFIDTYYLPWIPRFYMKIHSIHAVLIIGMDQDNVYCNDTPPFFQPPVKGYPLSLVQFKEAFIGSCYTVRKNAVQKHISQAVQTICKKTSDILGTENQKSIFSSMRDFAQYIIEESIELVDLEDFDGGDGILIRAIRNILRDRVHFSKALKYLGETLNCAVYTKLYGEFQGIIQDWMKVKLILYKSYIAGDTASKQTKLPAIINHIADSEENLAYRMLSNGSL